MDRTESTDEKDGGVATISMLTREDIQRTDDRRPFPIQVPEWNGTVLGRALDGNGRRFVEDWLAKHKEPNREGNLLSAHLVVKATVKSDGTPMFTKDDITWLLEKNGNAIDRIATAILTESGLNKKASEEIEGNSKSGHTSASTTS